MVKCPKCGFENPEGKFCIACGQTLINMNNNPNMNNNDKTATFNNPQDNINPKNNSNDFQRTTYTHHFQNNLKDNDSGENNNYQENTTFNQENTRVQATYQQNNIPANANNQINNQYNNQGFNNNGYNQYNTNAPISQKSKIVGFLLGFFIPGLGYGYVNKWKEAIIIFIGWSVLTILGFLLTIILIGVVFSIIALILWIYSLIKTMDMIDKYNAGIPY